jgi:tripartite-type tricarboxylate transporter receptor subunit TctC
LAASTADGYTISIGSNGQLSYSPNLYKNLPYDTNKAFKPITQVSSSSFALVVSSKLPVKSVKEFVEYVKARPGKMNNGSAGIGSTGHLAMELFKNRVGIDMAHIPYKGSAPMVTALITGEVDAAIVDIPPMLGFIKNGEIRPLAVSGNTKSHLLPELPTIAESGVPGTDNYYVTSFMGFLAPTGTPEPIIQKLHAAFVKINEMPEVQKALREQGMDSIPATTPEQFAAFLIKDRAEAKDLIEGAKIKAE